MPGTIFGALTALESELVQLIFIGSLAPLAVSPLAEALRTIAVDGAFVFRAPLFGHEFQRAHFSL